MRRGVDVKRNGIVDNATLVSGMILGATAMYILDPQQGRRRRALARDKAVRGAHLLGRWLNRQARDLGNRAIGNVAEWRSSVRDSGRDIEDDRLVSRVRAQLGHVVAHPGSLQIHASNGVVTIGGPVLSHEIEKVRERISKTRGVRECRLDVDAHESRGSVPGLQGVSRSERRESAS
jgi:hypothetical protein